MNFILQHDASGEYSTKTGYRRVLESAFIMKLLKFGKHCYGATSTEHSQGLLKRAKHIPVLDIDSFDCLLAAQNWLKTATDIKFQAVCSSPQHYWLILDVFDKWRNVSEIINTTPGTDEKYKRLTKHIKNFQVRLIPKPRKDDWLWGHPTGSPAIYDPIFPDECDLVIPEVVAWYGELKAWFAGDGYHKLKKALILRLAISNGTIPDMAQDPAFVV